MTTLSEAELREKVRQCAQHVTDKHGEIRELQNKMLEEIPLPQWELAMAALDAILGKNRIIHMSETTSNKFENVGVANTGKMSGTITGNSQSITNNESAKALIDAFADFKRGISSDPTLSPEQKEDALSAASQLEEEVQKPETGWNMSRIRNGVAALKTLAGGAQAIHTLYDQVHPLLASHFHLLG